MQNMNPNGITPQSFETNDERYSIKVTGEDWLELSLTEYNETDSFCFDYCDLEVIIALLERAREINTKAWEGEEK